MSADPRLVRRVQESAGLTTAEAERLIEDVLTFHHETVQEWVTRRHVELQAEGIRNVEIFPRLRVELADLVVAAPDLSERQLRRLVYG